MFKEMLMQDTTGDIKMQIREYMRWFPKVPRFEMLTLFMDDKEKQDIKAVCSAVDVNWGL